MTTSDINKVIEQARAWYGINERDSNFAEIVRIYNEIPNARGPALISYPWCAIYVSAVYWKAIGESRFAEMACDAMINKFQNLGLYSASGQGDVGDVLFYDWDGNGTSDHVGIILEVADNGYTVIEGNKSDAVGCRRIAYSYPYIKGIGFATRLDGKVDSATNSSGIGQQMAEKVVANRKRPTIQFGSTGDAVMLAQAILVDLGYLNKGGKNYANVDGDFGLLTKAATMSFQSATRDSADPLVIDGIIGKNTWAKLLQAIEE